MKPPLIDSKGKFREVLEAALAKARQHVAAGPDDPFQKSILAQLEFMARSTADNLPASQSELEKLNLGVIAVRTLEDTEPEYASMLSELEYAFRRWPTLRG
jgi:Tsi6